MSSMAEMKETAVKIANKAINTKGFRYDPEIIRRQADEIADLIISGGMEITGEIKSLCLKNNEDFVKSLDYFTARRNDSDEYNMAADYISDIYNNMLSNNSAYKSYAAARKKTETGTDFIGFVLALARGRYMSKLEPIGKTAPYSYSSVRTNIYSSAFYGKLKDYCREHNVEVGELYLPKNDELANEILNKVRNGEPPFTGFDGKKLTRKEFIEIACRITNLSIFIQDDSEDEQIMELRDKTASLEKHIEAVDTVISYIRKANEMLDKNILLSDDRSSVKNKKGNTYYGYFMVIIIKMILEDNRCSEYLNELLNVGWQGKSREVFSAELYSAAEYFDTSESPTIAGLGRCFSVDMVENYSNGLKSVYRRLREAMDS